MSIRRKSCDPCFKARRKCDLEFPVCARCQRSSRVCHYVYPPQQPGDETIPPAAPEAPPKASAALLVRYRETPNRRKVRSGHGRSVPSGELRHRSIQRFLGNLGELAPILGRSRDCSWMYSEIRAYPLSFSLQAETVFIHRNLYGNAMPRSLRAAFGICSGCRCINERNSAVLFQSLDAELLELLTPPSTRTLAEDLAGLQAIVLYQIIRLFYGGIQQRLVAEQQEYVIRLHGLKLLQQYSEELRREPRTWEEWIVAESVRRTVIIAFKLYTAYANYRYGTCPEMEAMRILPVSTQPSLWNSPDGYLQLLDHGETTTYEDFSSNWVDNPRAELEPFEKLLLVGCKGIDDIEAVVGPLFNTELLT
ncbi:hypothetical protein BX600DRAFT_510722 [Xylariales sp. PMI_506]|nr:hypothetical protein BX600DRAFT_510722 [Xylariales sp. PMI_506]